MNPVVIGDSTYIPITPEQAHTLYKDVQLYWSFNRRETGLVNVDSWHKHEREHPLADFGVCSWFLKVDGDDDKTLPT